MSKTNTLNEKTEILMEALSKLDLHFKFHRAPDTGQPVITITKDQIEGGTQEIMFFLPDWSCESAPEGTLIRVRTVNK